MRTGYKAVIVLGSVVAAIIIFANWVSFINLINYMYTSGSYLIIILLLVGAAIAIPILRWAEFKWDLRIIRSAKDKRIPQPERIAIGRSWLEEHWKSETVSKGLVLVDNYITPHREDARPIEMMLFTTTKVFKDQRIDVANIPQSQRFYVFVDCISGECFSIAYMNSLLSEEAVKFINRYWFMGIKERIDTPVDKWIRESMARATGEELAKREIERTDKKEEVKA